MPALDAFLAVATQWRESGLDYAGVRAGLKLAEIEVDARLWADIQQIEIGARRALAEKWERERGR